MIVLDTSVLIDALTAARPLADGLHRVLDSGERVLLPAPVLYEWRRGPRKQKELEVQQSLFPDERTIVFGPAEARVAADLYRVVPRPRGREADIAIAACTLTQEGRLWTVNEQDFADIPGLPLFSSLWRK